MAENKIRLRVFTPDEIKVDEDVDMVVVRCLDGDMGILPGHEPFSVALDSKPIQIVSGGNRRLLDIQAGLAEIEENRLTIVTSGATWPEGSGVDDATQPFG